MRNPWVRSSRVSTFNTPPARPGVGGDGDPAWTAMATLETRTSRADATSVRGLMAGCYTAGAGDSTGDAAATARGSLRAGFVEFPALRGRRGRFERHEASGY
jgi:hypothetical protein